MLMISLRRIKDRVDGTRDYVYEVKVTLSNGKIKPVSQGFVYNHKPQGGWQALLMDLAQKGRQDMDTVLNDIEYEDENENEEVEHG